MNDLSTQLFENRAYVKGVRNMLKEAALLKYASEEQEEDDTNAVASAMIDENMNASADKAMDENKVLDIANTLIDLASEAPSPQKEELTEAASEVAKTVAPAGEAVSEKELNESKEAAQKLAAFLRKRADVTTDPKEVSIISKTDYTVVSNADYNAKGVGQTSLDTSKGEIGKQENVEHKIIMPVTPTADVKQNIEGADIHAKDYLNGKGQSTLPTETAVIGKEENVEYKLKKIALQQNLAKILGK